MKPIVLVTGSAGLVGSETSLLFFERGWDVVGIDNDLRSEFFGKSASTNDNLKRIESKILDYRHCSFDIRDFDKVNTLLEDISNRLGAVIHTAAQPSHDWAAKEPLTDFSVNATGTLNLLEATRLHKPDVPFIFTSTNKVYGDLPNSLPLVEDERRYIVSPEHGYAERGIDENMSLDQSLHSVFGASKVAADIMVQEYGSYFDMPTVCFRGGCLTGPAHAGAELHGFLAYLVRACVENLDYSVFGYKGKQVRDNLHARDLAEAFWQFVQNPRSGVVYNMGGGIFSNCSMLEAIDITEQTVGRKLNWTYEEQARRGDHMWWISNLDRFRSDYPDWRVEKDVPAIIDEIACVLRDGE